VVPAALDFDPKTTDTYSEETPSTGQMSSATVLSKHTGTAAVGEIKRNGTYNLPIHLTGRWKCKPKTRCRNS
jgi:hypothetical protein